MKHVTVNVGAANNAGVCDMADKPVHYLPDDEYAKAIGQFRLATGYLLSVFDLHGLGIYIPGVQDEIVKLAEDYGLRIRGVNKPISIEYIRRKKSKERK